jgi:hypothetical protein
MASGILDPTPFERYLDTRHPMPGVAECLDARAFVEQLFANATDLEYLRKYAAACPVPGATPDLYAARVLQIASTCLVVAAIHFRGRDTDFPFVDVSAQSAPLPRPLPLTRIVAPFLRFRPRAVRMWRAATEALPEGGEDDLVVVAGPLRALQAGADLPNVHRIRLEADPGLEWFGAYRRTYDAVYSAAPGTAAFAQPEPRSVLAACAREGAFFRVLIDNVPAGFIAARPRSYRCWRGWNMTEEVLHPDFRGRHLAPALQQAFLRKLDADRERCVFGTIAAANTPSLRTALRVGRRVVEVGTFLAGPAEAGAVLG